MHRYDPSDAGDVIPEGEPAMTTRPWERPMNGAGLALRRVENRIGSTLRVLIYHRIADGLSDPWQMTVSPSNFSEQVAVLVDAARLVVLDERLSSRTSTRPGRARRYALTFDDGYLDNLRVALPILEHHDAPATVFIATGYLDQPYFWWDRLGEIVFGSVAGTTSVVNGAERVGLLEAEGVEPLAEAAPARVHERLHHALTTRTQEERNGLLDELASATSFAAPSDAPRPLTSEELQHLAAHPLITIGAHTHTHPRLTALAPEAALRDIRDGGDRLDDLLGRRCRLFAYPHGAADASVARLVKRAGHDHAFTTVSRPMSCIDSPLMLPRIASADVGGAEFARRRGLAG